MMRLRQGVEPSHSLATKSRAMKSLLNALSRSISLASHTRPKRVASRRSRASRRRRSSSRLRSLYLEPTPWDDRRKGLRFNGKVGPGEMQSAECGARSAELWGSKRQATKQDQETVKVRT